MEEYTKTVKLTFKRQELLCDCEQAAYVEADIMKAEDEHARHQVFDITQDGNVDRVTRVLDLVFARCVELCYPYTKEEVETVTELDDTFQETQEYVMQLKVPDDMSKTTLNYLVKLIHEYLVCSILADWLSITKAESKVNWLEKAESVSSEITSSINARCRRVRRKPHPF